MSGQRIGRAVIVALWVGVAACDEYEGVGSEPAHDPPRGTVPVPGAGGYGNPDPMPGRTGPETAYPGTVGPAPATADTLGSTR